MKLKSADMDGQLVDIHSGKNTWMRILLMFIVSALIGCALYYFSNNRDWRNFASAFLFTFSLWEGNYRLSFIIIKKYPSLEESSKRFWISFIFVFVYTLMITIERISFCKQGENCIVQILA